MGSNISYEKFIAGAVLKYEKVDILDISILIDMIKRDYGLSIEKTEFSNDSISLVDVFYQIGGKTEKEKAESRRKLFSLQDQEVKDIFDKLNYEEYVLRKIDLFEGISEDILAAYSLKFQKMVGVLQFESFLSKRWNDDNLPIDFEEYCVTQRGKLYLFLIENATEIQEFKNLLRTNGYNDLIVVDFLRTQNLDDDANNILTLERFIDFCNTYDRNLYLGSDPKTEIDGQFESPKNINEFLKKYPN